MLNWPAWAVETCWDSSLLSEFAESLAELHDVKSSVRGAVAVLSILLEHRL